MGATRQNLPACPGPGRGKRQAQMAMRVASRRVEDVPRQDKTNLRIRRLMYFKSEGARLTFA